LFCLLALLLAVLPAPDARADGAGTAAAAIGNAGLAACGSKAGKDLHNCVADVLEKMSARLQPASVQQTQSELLRAASGLRAAVDKAQAVLAITQCQNVIGTALKQIAAIGGKYVRGWGNSEMNAVSAVLARAARLIQAKG
jgi:hypothetical protein